MADDLKNPGAQDRNRVNIIEDHEVRYWTQKWGVTKEQLMAAVKKAGASVEEVTIQIDVFLSELQRRPVGTDA